MKPIEVTTLPSLRRYLGIKKDEWDVIIIGDGSGTTWEKEMGWGSVLIRSDTFERKAFYGAMSHGTNNMGEMMAVLQPLMFLTQAKSGVKPGGLKVHVISDSEYVVNGLAKMDPIWIHDLKTNRELWMAMHMTRRKGLLIKSHHIPRDIIDLNKLSHNLANMARRSQIQVRKDFDEDIYKANPED